MAVGERTNLVRARRIRRRVIVADEWDADGSSPGMRGAGLRVVRCWLAEVELTSIVKREV